MRLKIVMLMLVAAAFSGVIYRANGATGEDGEQKLDITLVIAGDLARRGGLVELVIRPDPGMTSIPETLEVALTSIASVILIDLPVGAPYTYRFRRLDGGDAGETKRITVGTYLQGSGRPEATILSHHVEMGGDWTLDQSYRLSAAISASAAEADYPCQTVSGVVVCDASAEVLRGLPN